MKAPPHSSPSPSREIWALLTEVLDLPERDRERFLGDLRRGRPDLTKELEALLEASGEGAALAIEAKLPGAGPGDDGVGILAGPYRLVRRIGSGGMGDVYLAERADGSFAQRVAVKLMRPGLASVETIERFRLERDVLARLTHPAVVPLLDGGTTSDGRPYLALQHVEGRPITDHCRERGLSRTERLRLFVELCRAVQYAHANLVIHRDLKPSNVLVTPDGEIRLLDFGVAKLLDDSAEDREITTGSPAPMTLRRAAPEQRAGAAPTTATDVFALGVLLHELVTGLVPEVEEGGVRRADRDGVERGLPRDVIAVVTMALAPEPEDRYPSAGHLADDVERFLASEPILARPDSWVYRTGRFVRRHRAGAAAAGLTALFLVVLAVVSTVQALRIAEERNRVTAEERRSNAVVELLVELFGATDPVQGADLDTILVSDLIDRGEAHANRLEGQPEVQARLRGVLGKILLERGDGDRGRGLIESALESQRRRLGEDDLRTIETAFDLIRAQHLAGEIDEARDLARVMVERVERRIPPDPNLLAGSLQTLGGLLPNDEGRELLERAIEIRRASPDVDPVAQGQALTALATHYQILGETEKARDLFQEALNRLRPVMGEGHPQILALRSNLAFFLEDPRDRILEHEEILAARLDQLGPDHVLVGNSWIGSGHAYRDAGDPEGAERGFREGVRIWGASRPTASRTRQAVLGLVWAFEETGRSPEARELLDRTLELYEGAGEEPPVDLLWASLENRARSGSGVEASVELAELDARLGPDDPRRARLGALR